MAIATAIAAAAAIGGAVLSSKAQKKAANQASQAATDNTAANNALARDIYGQNKATLAPFVNTGTNASSAINALLGLGGQGPQVGPYDTPGYGGPVNGQPNYLGGALGQFGGNFNGGAIRYEDNQYGATNGYTPGDQMMTTNVNTAPPQVNPQQQYQNAFDNYKNSTGYQFRVNEGGRALDNSYASRGVGQSGAAAKAALQYGQNIASGEFGNYLNALQGQQGVGLSAAGAQAGVSTNFVNQTTANNNSGASALANAAIAKGNATGQMWSGIAGGIGNIFGSSFG